VARKLHPGSIWFIAGSLLIAPAVFARQETRKFELVWNYNLIFDQDKVASQRMAAYGFGPAVSVFLTKHIAAEADYSFYLHRDYIRPVPGDLAGFKPGITEANYGGPAHVILFGIRPATRRGNDPISARKSVLYGSKGYGDAKSCDVDSYCVCFAGIWLGNGADGAEPGGAGSTRQACI
jgi:hypothetical protein